MTCLFIIFRSQIVKPISFQKDVQNEKEYSRRIFSVRRIINAGQLIYGEGLMNMAKLYIVGIGPGGKKHMTAAAKGAIDKAEIVCGYTLYLELIKDMIRNKEIFSSPMTKEAERCNYAVEKVREGRTVALVCSGDPGVYGMAAPALEISEDIDVEVIPGVSAAESGASVLGAPLSDDHCIISLSDINTPWETIEKRLEFAARADLVIVLYNPMSKHRRDNLKKACKILLKEKKADTVCGYVRNIAREGEEKRILTLSELKDAELDMFTTVFIGSSQTLVSGEYMVTPRTMGRESSESRNR